MPKIRDVSTKLIFSIAAWFIGVLIIMEERFWSTVLIHSSSFFYLMFLFFFIRQNSNSKTNEQITFWKKSDPSLSRVFSGRRIRNNLLLVLTPIIIWSNWWPHNEALSIHNWQEIERRAIVQLEESEQLSDPILNNFKTQWNDSTTIKEYYLTTPSDTGTLVLVVNKQDS